MVLRATRRLAEPVRACQGSRGAQPRVWAAWQLLIAVLGGVVALDHRPAAGAEVATGLRVEVVATGIPRPIQLAFDARGALVVLSHGWRGDAAGEIYRIDVGAPLPVDLSRAPRVVVPFAVETRKTALGSLAIDASSGDLFLGEENGNRIYRLGLDHRLESMVVGLNHLLGGSVLEFDRRGRLVFLDYASAETHLRSETPLPPSLSWLTEEGYRGPLVFRIDPREERPLPRRTDFLTPVLPRRGAGAAGRSALAAHRRDGRAGRPRLARARSARCSGSAPTGTFTSSPGCPAATITGRT